MTDKKTKLQNDGKLPKQPTVKKEELTKIDVDDVNTAQKVVDQSFDADPQNVIFDKHSKRGQLAMEVVKALVSKTGNSLTAKEVSKYAFEVADAVQDDINEAYGQEVLKYQVKNSGFTN